MCKVKGGFRVELPEIRAQIQSYPSVDDCYVSLADITNPNGESGEKQIVAHVVFKEDAGRDMQVVENWKNVRLFSIHKSNSLIHNSHVHDRRLITTQRRRNRLASKSTCRSTIEAGRRI